MKKSKEEIIREEMRHIGDISVRLCQWGVTVLISLQTALFFMRKDTFDRMSASGELAKGEHLPWSMYLVGTLILAVIAALFTGMTILVGKSYRHYHKLLIEHSESGLPVMPVNNSGRFMAFALFFTFPILDILVRFYIQLNIGVK